MNSPVDVNQIRPIGESSIGADVSIHVQSLAEYEVVKERQEYGAEDRTEREKIACQDSGAGGFRG